MAVASVRDGIGGVDRTSPAEIESFNGSGTEMEAGVAGKGVSKGCVEEEASWFPVVTVSRRREG